jgi:hypothetical protein
MNENKQKIHYNYNFLQLYCKENGIVLTNNYNEEKITRDTIIEAKCLTEDCDDNVSKGFRSFFKIGSYCHKCSVNKGKAKSKILFLEKYDCEYPTQNKEIKEKRKKTMIEKYGCENAFQSEEIKEKIKKQNMEKYGCEYYLQTKEKQLKSKETCIEKFGVEYCMQNEKIKEKAKTTNIIKYGSEYPMQNEEIKTKVKQTNVIKYGCENAMQNEEIKEKVKQTFIEKYGCEHSLLSKEIKEKMENTMLERYGVKYTTQNKDLLNKVKNTFLDKYGVEWNFQNEEIKDKIKQTCLEKYGCENPMQHPEVSEKQSNNAYKSKDYIFPSGRMEKIQGYEHFMLNDLLQKENVSEDDIIVKRSEVPIIWYEDITGKKHRYFVDCFIKSQNRCIEVKSTWTAKKKTNIIYLKQQSVKNAGYLCEIWIYDDNGNIVEKLL